MAGESHPEVLIIGGGVIGSAIAYFLTAEAPFAGRVTVVEMDPGYANCSTSRSCGSIRQQFSTPENIRMSAFGMHFISHLHEHLAVDGETPDVSLIKRGYLFLASTAGRAILEQNHAVQKRHGAVNILLDRRQLEARFPWMDCTDIDLGSLGVEGEGWLDPYALLQAFRRKARQQGAHYRRGQVVEIVRRGDRIQHVLLDDGSRLSAGHFVNAAGPRARELAAGAGIELPVHPRKRQVFVFACRETISACPLVIDPCGLYFRPEGKFFICGISPPPEEDPDCLDLEVDHDWFEDRLWPLLARRVPAFERIKVQNAWAGHYAYNTFDQNAILGVHPQVENYFMANGFSGHGLQQSPAVGRAISELIRYGEYRSLDLSHFDYARIAQNRPVIEHNIV